MNITINTVLIGIIMAPHLKSCDTRINGPSLQKISIAINSFIPQANCLTFRNHSFFISCQNKMGSHFKYIYNSPAGGRSHTIEYCNSALHLVHT